MKTDNIEIERKWLIKEVPTYIIDSLSHYDKFEIFQAYVSFFPHIRIRKSNNNFVLNFKKTINNNDLTREEFEFNISEEEYNNLLKKTEGLVIHKTRYLIPIENNLVIELDYFHDEYQGLIYAEVEFPSIDAANSYTVPYWFFKELTGIKEFNNMYLSKNPISVKEIYN